MRAVIVLLRRVFFGVSAPVPEAPGGPPRAFEAGRFVEEMRWA